MIKELKFSDVMETSVITVCAELSKVQTRELFAAVWATPYNDLYEPDENYIGGELQFNFDKETKELTEVLLFPIYGTEDNKLCGDFVDAPDYIWEKFEEAAKSFAFNKEG